MHALALSGQFPLADLRLVEVLLGQGAFMKTSMVFRPGYLFGTGESRCAAIKHDLPFLSRPWNT